MSYQDFKNEWLGRRIDYDHVYGFQCVDLILEYIKECYGIASGVWGNAIDYWNSPSPALLAKFNRIGTTDCQQGDIVVFNGHPGNPYGHIAICDSQDSVNVTVLEQNGGGGGTGVGSDAIRLRAIPKNRIAGILRAKAAAPQAKPRGTAQVVRQCYVRSAPNTAAGLAGSQVLVPGNTFVFIDKVHGQNVNGNDVWYLSQFNHYVWSGNCKDL